VNLRSLLVATLAVCGWAAAASGEEPELQRAEEIVIEDVVEKELESFDSNPVETEVLIQKEIEERPATTADQIVNRLPGIRTQQRIQGEEAAVSIEGLPPEFTRALVDGRRYTGEIGGVDDLKDLPLANVQRIEVVRGAQGLRFGSEAAGGVIRVITEDPPADGWRADLDSGFGSATHVLGAGSVALGGPKVGGSLRFVHEQIDGYGTPENVDAVVLGTGKDSRSMSEDVYGTFVTRPFANVELQTRGGYRQENDDLSAFDDFGDGTTDTTRWLASQDVIVTLGEHTRVEGGLTYYRNGIKSTSARNFTLDEDEWGLNGIVERVIDFGPVVTTLMIGTDLRRPTLDLNEGEPDVPIPGYTPGNVDEHSGQAGFFWIAETDFTSWLTLESGFRVQLHNDFEPAYLPQLALMVTPWEPGDGRLLRFRASWGKSFRAPSLRDRFQPAVPQLGGSYYLEGNPDLDPESLRSYRLGFEAVANRWLGFSVTGFYNDITDHIRSTYDRNIPIGEELVYFPPGPIDPDPELELICEAAGNVYPECNPEGSYRPVPITAPLYRKQNLDDVKTAGLEARVRLQPHRLLAVDIGYTYLNTHVKDTNIDLSELPNEAPNMVDTIVSLTVPRFDSVLTVQTRWRDRALTETSGTGGLGFGSTEKSDPSVQLDMRILQPIGERFALYFDGLNLTNTRVVDSYVVRGRTFFGGVRANFNGSELW
jgi:outer membrane receptor for ferrienterochelin and colicins